MKFGNEFRKQSAGTAMGNPPAPAWATIFEGLHELEFFPRWKNFLVILKRFIDDGFGIWLPPAELSDEEAEAKWVAFKADVNDDNGLEWVFEEKSTSVVFLDLRLTINESGLIKTTLYQKPMALHLFIPPNSMHPPGVLYSHVCGNVLRIFRLNSDETDRIADTVQFIRRFKLRGHRLDSLKPLFLKAIENAKAFVAKSDTQRAADKEVKAEAARRRLYLHIEYHDQNPSAHQMQQLFSELVLRPFGKTPLNEMESGHDGAMIPIDAMIIANHRAPNLGDMFSYRDIGRKINPPA
jgi:hypothetical protein